MSALQLDLFGVEWFGTIIILVLACLVGAIFGTVLKNGTKPQGVRERMALGDCPHNMIRSPSQHGRKGILDRLSPLYYEESKDGKWKISLGRVAFWTTQIGFLVMCAAVVMSMKDVQSVDGNLVTLYISVITMLFLTNLGLLAYNLGSKFTEPMKAFIAGWHGGKGGGIDLPINTTPRATPESQEEPEPEPSIEEDPANQEEPPDDFIPGGM